MMDVQVCEHQLLVDASGKTEDDFLQGCSDETVISFQVEIPVQLQSAMASFIERYPNWDQYRLVQAAIAGFLVQNGVESRAITRLYVGNMFRCECLI